ncbi:MAG: hypothetical protein LBD32_02230 [Cytophagales bacterium]|nr:hypothetical protein [Cytophagales bacterium]
MVKFFQVNECVNFLKSKNKILGIDLGLERISRTLEKLNYPQKRYKTIHVAGTNGKGSTITMISSILQKAGFKVGSYFSPKINLYNEMFLFNGEIISDSDLVKNFNEIINHCENLTTFEILTVIAFNFFKNENVDYAVIEVGCGGLLDATNVIDPVATIITNITEDHRDLLGDVVQHKLGIIKNNVPLITAIQDEEILDKIYNLLPKEKVFVYKKDFFSRGEKIWWDSQVVRYEDENDNFDFEIKLLGDFQIANSAVAIKTCLEVLGRKINLETIREGLLNAKIHYRFEKIEFENKIFILDAAHNLAGIEVLQNSLKKYFGERKKNVIIGILQDKDYKNMLPNIIAKEDFVIVVRPYSERACDPKILFDLIDCKEKYIAKSYEDALNKALNAKNELTVVTGTLFNDDIPKKYLRKVTTTF